MKIFGLHILTQKQINRLRDKITKDAFCLTKLQLGETLIPELKRLQKDHWDKQAFDNLIKKYSKK